MANLVKVKNYGMLIFSIPLIAILSYAEPYVPYGTEYKYWTCDSTLYFSDFKKMRPLLERAPIATIYMNIELKKGSDSLYKAYAVINRAKSWFGDPQYSEYLLRHEQYHANLNYAVVKKVNSIISGEHSEEDVYLYYTWARNEAIRLTKLYDKDTEHSLNEPMQHFWEYKIDSMCSIGN